MFFLFGNVIVTADDLEVRMKETIRLVLADIDGTLLNDQGQVTPLTCRMIHELHDAGIMFGISTGRTPYAVRRLLYDWGIADATDYIVGFNGGSIYDVHTQKMTSYFELSGKAMFEMFDDLKDFDFNACIYDRDTIHALRRDEIMERTAQMNKLELIIDDFEGYRNGAVNKVLITAEKEEMDRIVEFCDAHSEGKPYKAKRSADVRLECIHPDLSKSRGIALLCVEIGLQAEEVLTFGDMMNDFEMIRDYVGVAMGNADPRVTAVSRYQTASNNEDGIGLFIRDHLLKQKEE